MNQNYCVKNKDIYLPSCFPEITSTWESEKRKLKWTGMSVRRSSRSASCWLRLNNHRNVIITCMAWETLMLFTFHFQVLFKSAVWTVLAGVLTSGASGSSLYDKIMHIKCDCTFQEGFSFQLYTGCTRVFLGAYFWECAVLQSSAADGYNHWLSQVFWPIQRYLQVQTLDRKYCKYQAILQCLYYLMTCFD